MKGWGHVKKSIAIILETIPVVSAIVSCVLLFSQVDSSLVRAIIAVTMPLAFLGFVMFFIGRRLVKGDKAVLILGILDLLATVSIIGIYAVAFLVFAW